MTTDEDLQVHVVPPRVWIQRVHGLQALNFDLHVRNRGEAEWTLRGLDLEVRDEEDRLVLRRRLDENGVVPSVATLGPRSVKAGGDLYLFNPFWSLPANLPLDRLVLFLHLTSESRLEVTLPVEARPRPYRQRVDLRLPLEGPLLVDDGHDYYAHHRRLPLSHPWLRELGWTANSMRFAWDLQPVNGDRRPRSRGPAHEGYFRFDLASQGLRNEDYVGFGVPVRAPGAGHVVRTRGDVSDHPPWNPVHTLEELGDDPAWPMGNHVVLDHGHGEYSLLAHLQEGSLALTEGERVEQGQELGRLGNSGDSYYPHLHYQLMDGPDLARAEGLPARFSGYRWLLGREARVVAAGAPHSGDLLLGDPPRPERV